jgi:hypothetical protein
MPRHLHVHRDRPFALPQATPVVSPIVSVQNGNFMAPWARLLQIAKKTTGPGQPMTDTAPRPRWRTAYLCAALAVGLLGWHTLFEPFGRDQGIHATIAYAWGEGLTT